MQPSLDAILEAALLAAGEPLTIERLRSLFPATLAPTRAEITQALKQLAETYREQKRGLELVEVASGWRLQVPLHFAPWVSLLWEEKAGRYSRAFLEILAVIAWKQPVTRGDIEQVRGVAVSSQIMRTLQEKGWVQVVGTREVPGRPSLYGTTKIFLDHFQCKSLADLPPLPVEEKASPLANPEASEKL